MPSTNGEDGGLTTAMFSTSTLTCPSTHLVFCRHPPVYVLVCLFFARCLSASAAPVFPVRLPSYLLPSTFSSPPPPLVVCCYCRLRRSRSVPPRVTCCCSLRGKKDNQKKSARRRKEENRKKSTASGPRPLLLIKRTPTHGRVPPHQPRQRIQQSQRRQQQPEKTNQRAGESGAGSDERG